MLQFIAKRSVHVVLAALGITAAAFWAPRLMGSDPCQIIVGPGRPGRTAAYMACRERLALDRPLVEQYLTYMSRLARGDIGTSFTEHEPVLDLFLIQFAATSELALLALLLGVATGMLAGMLAARQRGSVVDHMVRGMALTGYSMPIFWWGLVLLMLFSGVLPQGQRIDASYAIDDVTGWMLIDSVLSGHRGALWSAIRHLILPVAVLSTIPMAVVTRQTRSAVLEVQNEDYVRTAYSKGLSPRRVWGVHVLRAALVPVVTTIGLQVSVLLGGAVLTESLFSRRGVGLWLLDAARDHDYPRLEGGILLVSAVGIAVNLLVDVACNLLDPRLRARQS